MAGYCQYFLRFFKNKWLYFSPFSFNDEFLEQANERKVKRTEFRSQAEALNLDLDAQVNHLFLSYNHSSVYSSIHFITQSFVSRWSFRRCISLSFVNHHWALCSIEFVLSIPTIFLVADTQLYERLWPSVHLSAVIESQSGKMSVSRTFCECLCVGLGDRGVYWGWTPLPTRPQRYCDPAWLAFQSVVDKRCIEQKGQPLCTTLNRHCEDPSLPDQ